MHKFTKALAAIGLAAVMSQSAIAENLKLGFLVKQPEEPWFQTEWKFADKAGKDLGFEVIKIAVPDGAKTLNAIVSLAASVAWLLLASLGVGLVWLVLGMTGLSANDAEALREVGPSQNWQTVAIWAVGATGLAWWLGWKHPDASLLIGLLALHSAWMVRWAIFIGGQEVPKTGAGYYSYQLPLGPDGLLGILGTAGLWVFIFIVVTNVLPLDRVGRATPGQA